jgi:hypothetical protein
MDTSFWDTSSQEEDTARTLWSALRSEANPSGMYQDFQTALAARRC